MPRRQYVLTPTAATQLREAKMWSLARWGPAITAEYFRSLHEAAQDLAANYPTYRTRDELAGGTGLRLHPVREQYLVFEPVDKNRIAIVAVIRQGRDIPSILSKGKHVIDQELRALRNSSKK